MAIKSSSKQTQNNDKHQHEDFKGQFLRYTHTEKVFQWISQNLKSLGIAVGAIILIIVIGMSWSAYKEGMAEKAVMLEGKAFKLHQEAASKTADASTEDSSEAANPYQEVIALYQEIRDQYPGTESAERALYILGSIEYELGNYDKAQEYFSTYIDKHSKGLLLSEAEESLGYIFEQQKAYQKAIDTFKSVETKVPTAKKSAILLAIARNYESLEKFDDAIATYQSIVDSNTSFSLKNTAKERLDILQAGLNTPVPEKSEEESPATSKDDNTNG
jgi:tetratricopeptide (TPR) repeat protein